MGDSKQRLLTSLHHFGEPTYTEGRFISKEDHDYASITLVTREQLASTLEGSINSSLNELSGARCSIRFIGAATYDNGHYTYVIEIVPCETVPFHQWSEATDEYLQRLGRTIDDIGIKNPRRGK